MITFPDPTTFNLETLWIERQHHLPPEKVSDRDRFYRGSYPFILAHFRSCTFDGTKNDCGRFWQALILVYSWMGRGILTNFDDALARYRAACGTIKEARDSGRIDGAGLKTLVSLCNDSTIATSKFLHFLNPEAFAIWDSRVASAIFGGKAHHYILKDTDNLLAYFDWIKRVPVSSETIASVTSHLQLDADCGALRAREYMLFMCGEPYNGPEIA